MRRLHVRWLVGGLAHFSLVGGRGAAADDKEPAYRGKVLSAWVADLKDPDAEVRFDAAIALGRIRPAAKEAVGPLIEALRDKDNDVRYAATIALGKIGAPAVEPLIGVLRDQDPGLRGWRVGQDRPAGHRGAGRGVEGQGREGPPAGSLCPGKDEAVGRGHRPLDRRPEGRG